MNLCKDCKYFQGPLAATECLAPGNEQPDYVNGGMRYKQSSAQSLRIHADMNCGVSAKWFVARAEEMATA